MFDRLAIQSKRHIMYSLTEVVNDFMDTLPFSMKASMYATIKKALRPHQMTLKEFQNFLDDLKQQPFMSDASDFCGPSFYQAEGDLQKKYEQGKLSQKQFSKAFIALCDDFYEALRLRYVPMFHSAGENVLEHYGANVGTDFIDLEQQFLTQLRNHTTFKPTDFLNLVTHEVPELPGYQCDFGYRKQEQANNEAYWMKTCLRNPYYTDALLALSQALMKLDKDYNVLCIESCMDNLICSVSVNKDLTIGECNHLVNEALQNKIQVVLIPR